MAVDSGVTGVSVLSVSGVWVMTVAELKEELEVRGEGKSGNLSRCCAAGCRGGDSALQRHRP